MFNDEEKKKRVKRDQAGVNALEKQENVQANRIIRWIIITLLLICIVFALLMGTLVATGGFGEEKETQVTIPQGASTSQIAHILSENDVIFNESLFKIYLRLSNHDPIQAGSYQLKTSSGFGEVMNQLSHAQGPATQAVLVKEGMNVEEIAQVMADYFGITQEEALKRINSEDLLAEEAAKYPELLKAVVNNDQLRYPLEGYLFPATYELTQSDTVESFVDKMLAASETIRQKYSDALKQQSLSWHEILTLASIIEKEASTDEDRKMVSGVFYNRLAENMPLQSDITLNYAHNEHSTYVTIEDTMIDSPYNLYQNTGLGPGPFNNPSESAIQASLNPTPNDYMYFVADLSTGKVYFSKTYEEHDQLVQEYVSPEDAKLQEQ
ncbi:endolytic transglycosylase MltG [Aerococcus sp. JJEM-2022a]|uniref:endolytic transglycosylase MltG n=1 Tax=Aerococcus loyolae TaxID=2976809 RepID=UPI00227993FD|nr:endolytic transglycosylase MltG [Aerococcus loyolae]MCY3028276.1 endolytic transglycosylase MltG [Aerococcus loyolae]